MKKKLYKYVSPDIIEKMFLRNRYVHFKCSYPDQYNDPYELFLSVDPTEIAPEVIAYYHEIAGEVPKFPTTCFSSKPDIIPMWAHYAKEHRGCVVEVDEELLIKSTDELLINDVLYGSKIDSIDMDMIRHAYVTGKPRHTLRAQQETFTRAYFTKSDCWEYEFERRVILNEENSIKTIDGMKILEVPAECVTAIITGSRSEGKIKSICQNISESLSCNYYEMIIGRSSITPFFMDKSKQAFIFDGNHIVKAKYECDTCGEPMLRDKLNKCHWCATDDIHKDLAARANPMRILAHHGLLEDYLKGLP